MIVAYIELVFAFGMVQIPRWFLYVVFLNVNFALWNLEALKICNWRTEI